MSETTYKKIIVLLRQWFRKKVSEINHPVVIKDIYTEVDISAGYFVVLTFANLIALSGLLTNSAPVIIGAMLISPLMGPILSLGFAFITGEEFVLRKSVRKITISVALTIVVAAVASFTSPLNDITSEILSRTRPNLYDLGIAFLCGIAGSVALCTKKNYLTIVPGVAIATAVIPPLSVTGFGIGTGHFQVAFGGFFLFFTNFVAIIISTCIVFYFYGFTPSLIGEADIARLKKRVSMLAVVLCVISIPLIYTLHRSISEVTLQRKIQDLLKIQLDREKLSRVLTSNYLEKDGMIEINAVVNTVEYIQEEEIADMEKDMSASLNRQITLNLDQVKVQPRGLKKDALAQTASIPPPKPPWEVITESRENTIRVVRQLRDKMEKVISPSVISDLTVGFNERAIDISVDMKIKKDFPLNDDQVRWLKQMLASELGVPVSLTVNTVPFVPPVVFGKGDTELPETSKAEILSLKNIYAKDPSIEIMVESYPETGSSARKRRTLAQKRADTVLSLLQEECMIPEERIRTEVHQKAQKEPAVRISVITGK